MKVPKFCFFPSFLNKIKGLYYKKCSNKILPNRCSFRYTHMCESLLFSMINASERLINFWNKTYRLGESTKPIFMAPKDWTAGTFLVCSSSVPEGQSARWFTWRTRRCRRHAPCRSATCCRAEAFGHGRTSNQSICWKPHASFSKQLCGISFSGREARANVNPQL